ncbi:MAG TPA: hypothetical protein PL140_04830, partial [Ferrovaceae bacterium]|nr:hypothetical protein [Ferrovaceae bacterium]HQU06557.1 hypothetical protein [Ferrovaceae bacterium]
MADVTSIDSNEGASQINSDALHLDQLTSLQQTLPTNPVSATSTTQGTLHESAETVRVTPDNPSVVNQPSENTVLKSTVQAAFKNAELAQNNSAQNTDTQNTKLQLNFNVNDGSGNNNPAFSNANFQANLLNNSPSIHTTDHVHSTERLASGVTPPHVGTGSSKSITVNIATQTTVESQGSPSSSGNVSSTNSSNVPSSINTVSSIITSPTSSTFNTNAFGSTSTTGLTTSNIAVNFTSGFIGKADHTHAQDGGGAASGTINLATTESGETLSVV